MAKSKPYENLRRIAEAAGGAILSEFQELLAAATRTFTGMVSISDIRSYLDKIENSEGPKRRREPRAEPPAPSQGRRRGTRRTAPVARAGKSRRGKAAPTGKPKAGEWVLALLDLLKKRAAGNGTYKKALEESALRFFGRKKNRRRMVGSMVAHSVGKYRPEFLKKVAKSHPERINEDLAKLYSTIEGRQVTLEQLRSEAGM